MYYMLILFMVLLMTGMIFKRSTVDKIKILCVGILIFLNFNLIFSGGNIPQIKEVVFIIIDIVALFIVLLS